MRHQALQSSPLITCQHGIAVGLKLAVQGEQRPRELRRILVPTAPAPGAPRHAPARVQSTPCDGDEGKKRTYTGVEKSNTKERGLSCYTNQEFARPQRTKAHVRVDTPVQ